jgi:hypothetical protein
MYEEITEKEMGAPSSLIERQEPPYCPSTVTLWRRVALKKVRKTLLAETCQNGVRIEEVMDTFARRVDL